MILQKPTHRLVVLRQFHRKYKVIVAYDLRRRAVTMRSEVLMRELLLVILLGGSVWAQSLVEHAAAAGGGSVGGVAGKKVSDGITKIFNKVDKSTAKAAEGTKNA